jgi:hypothetical protein
VRGSDGVADLAAVPGPGASSTNLAFIGDEASNQVTVIDPPLPASSGAAGSSGLTGPGTSGAPATIGTPSPITAVTTTPAANAAKGDLLGPAAPVKTETKQKTKRATRVKKAKRAGKRKRVKHEAKHKRAKQRARRSRDTKRRWSTSPVGGRPAAVVTAEDGRIRRGCGTHISQTPSAIRGLGYGRSTDASDLPYLNPTDV